MTQSDPKPVVLVVDDEPDVLELLVYRLRNSGYDVLEAQRGEEALAIAADQSPDLIVLDAMMPGISGFEVTHRLRSAEATRDIPVILLTAKVQDADVAAGFKVGADDYIKKPFNPGELVTRIRAVLRRS